MGDFSIYVIGKYAIFAASSYLCMYYRLQFISRAKNVNPSHLTHMHCTLYTARCTMHNCLFVASVQKLICKRNVYAFYCGRGQYHFLCEVKCMHCSLNLLLMTISKNGEAVILTAHCVLKQMRMQEYRVEVQFGADKFYCLLKLILSKCLFSSLKFDKLNVCAQNVHQQAMVPNINFCSFQKFWKIYQNFHLNSEVSIFPQGVYRCFETK